MNLRNQPSNWDLNTRDPYIPVYYKGEIAGFFRPKLAAHIVTLLNEEENLHKALRNACHDLIREKGGNINQVKDLMKEYIANTKRPKSGTPAIIILLKERQEELDLNHQEFIQFCDSYKLSAYELQEIYGGEPVDDSLLSPLSRILGKSIEELMAIRNGSGVS